MVSIYPSLSACENNEIEGMGIVKPPHSLTIVNKLKKNLLLHQALISEYCKLFICNLKTGKCRFIKK